MGVKYRCEIKRHPATDTPGCPICLGVTPAECPYGRCPHCGAPCLTRERRLGGNDTCENGHVYPSAASVKRSPENSGGK